MIEGVKILNQTIIMESPTWFIVSIAILMGVIGICVITVIDSSSDGAQVVAVLLGLVSFLALLILLLVDPKVEAGRYQYEATVGESVSFTELYEKYDVVEQKGQLWILEDKKTE